MQFLLLCHSKYLGSFVVLDSLRTKCIPLHIYTRSYARIRTRTHARPATHFVIWTKKYENVRSHPTCSRHLYVV